MMKQFRTLLLIALLSLGLSQGPRALAANLVMGAHIGASEYSDLIYGANFTAHPYDMYGLRVDLTFGDGYISSHPGFIFYPMAYEEMSFGIIGGPGVIKVDGSDLRFSLNAGVLGTVRLGPAIEAGLDLRGIFPIKGENGYMIFATVGFIFGVGDGW